MGGRLLSVPELEKLLHNEEEILERWTEYVEDLCDDNLRNAEEVECSQQKYMIMEKEVSLINCETAD